ncbi:MAG: hypothetical protein AB7P78_18495 [Candidatus Binatia bacterium]
MEDFLGHLLGHLLRHLRGLLIVVWDDPSIHRPKGLQDLLRRYPRLHLEKLLSYAPQLTSSKRSGMQPSCRWLTSPAVVYEAAA